MQTAAWATVGLEGNCDKLMKKHMKNYQKYTGQNQENQKKKPQRKITMIQCEKKTKKNSAEDKT